MKEAVLGVMVVSAGFAGLSASYHLEKLGSVQKCSKLERSVSLDVPPHIFLGYRRMRRLLGIDCTVLVKKTTSSPMVV